jgi:hypothetical protein
MPCLLALMAAFFPRIGFLVLWLARPALVSAAFGSSFLLPVVGIIFLPFTTLFYVLLYHPGIGLYGWDWVWLGLAVLLDISHWFGSFTQRQYAQRYTGYTGPVA